MDIYFKNKFSKYYKKKYYILCKKYNINYSNDTDIQTDNEEEIENIYKYRIIEKYNKNIIKIKKNKENKENKTKI